MANKVGTFLKKKILGKDQNLISIDEPYQKMSVLFENTRISGIIDAGASNGSVSRRLLKCFPDAQVFAFEVCCNGQKLCLLRKML